MKPRTSRLHSFSGLIVMAAALACSAGDEGPAAPGGSGGGAGSSGGGAPSSNDASSAGGKPAEQGGASGAGGSEQAGASGTGGSVSGSGGQGGSSTAGAAGAAGEGGASTGGSSAGVDAGRAGAPGAADAAPSGGDAAVGQDGGSSMGGGTFDGKAVTAIMKRVADYEISRFGSTTSNGWVRAVFHTGMLAAYRVIGDKKYHDYTLNWGKSNNWQVSTDNSKGVRFADNQTCIQSYAELYLEDPTAQNANMIAAAQTAFDSMVAAPKTGRVEWYWCDALYMAPAAMARVAKATNKDAYFKLMNDMFWDTKAFLYDPAQSLFWRDKSYLNKDMYWARGNGWVIGGIVRILEALPATDSKRADYETLLKQMSTKLRSVQQSDGFWRSSLTQPNLYNMPESSGTAFFCFGIAWGINNGVLDRATYLPVVTKAWAALGTAVNAQGRLGWVQAVGQEPGASTADATNDYATGAFLLAGEQVMKL